MAYTHMYHLYRYDFFIQPGGLSVRLRDIGINIMGSIIELESLLEEQRARVSAERTTQREVRKKEQRLTFEQQMLRDYGKTIKIRTGLAQEEFEYILDLLRKLPEPVRRGRKLLDLDIRLVMFMQWLKFGQSYEQVAQSFHVKKSRVQTAISDLWTPMIETLTQNLLPKKPLDYTPTRSFDNYPHAAGALDATLIQVTKPLRTLDAREYLSGKHRKYGVRLQVLVAPDGQCIHYGGTINGRRHDFVLFEQSWLVNEMVKMVVQSDGTRIPTRPVILADGGYRGITVPYPEAVIPRRRLPPSQLSEEDQRFNTASSHDRIAVERFLVD